MLKPANFRFNCNELCDEVRIFTGAIFLASLSRITTRWPSYEQGKVRGLAMGMEMFKTARMPNVPTYYITDTIQEDAGGGNVRILNYTRTRGILVPQFVCIVASRRLLTVSRNITDLAQIVCDAELKRVPGDRVH